MHVRVVENGLDGLERDLMALPAKSARKFSATVRKTANEGNRIAKGFAKKSAGSHGKHYPTAFSAEMTGLYSAEYGPDVAMPQGGMSFEFGSKNQPPHLDLARSSDVIGPKFVDNINRDIDGLFW